MSNGTERRQQTFQRGESLLREGEYGDVAYVVLRGRVRISREIDGQRLRLAVVGPGQVIGEMALVDEKPRSATAIAEEETLVEVISRARFLHVLRTDPEFAIDLLKVLFERLREAQRAVVEWQRGAIVAQRDAGSPPAATVPPAPAVPATPVVLMTGVGEDAEDVLPEGGLRIARFPFRIGRRSRDQLVVNDYAIDDPEPYQISRAHLVFTLDDGRVALMDRGSYFGMELNGERLGGDDGTDQPVYLEDDNELWLGGDDSPYEFRVRVLYPEREREVSEAASV